VSLDNLIKDMNRKYKQDILVKGNVIPKSKTIPVSSPMLSFMLYGGIPRGKLIEFAGEENGGKTTTALDVVKNAQKLFVEENKLEIELLELKEKRNKQEENKLQMLKATGPKRILYADCENTISEDWCKTLGVDLENMILLKPISQTAEQIFEIILQAIETNELGLVVIDSLGVMLSAQAFEKTMEEKTYGGIASALTLFSKKAELLCNNTECTLIGINQMREDMNSTYGGQITTGGKGWKHNCSLRLMFQKGSYIDEDGSDLKRSAASPFGNIVNVSLAKTKVFKPDRRIGYYTLNYTYGIDYVADMIELGIRLGVINQMGSWFNIIDKTTGEVFIDEESEEEIKVHGKANLKKLILENGVIYNFIEEEIKKAV
jgi:recombination protein RecA